MQLLMSHVQVKDACEQCFFITTPSSTTVMPAVNKHHHSETIRSTQHPERKRKIKTLSCLNKTFTGFCNSSFPKAIIPLQQTP